MTHPAPFRGGSAYDEYYADSHVRQRVREYCGVDEHGVPSASRVATLNAQAAWPIGWETARHWPGAELDAIWRDDGDVARSLLDSRSLVFFIELDYEDPECPGAPFLNAGEVFRLMEPAFQALSGVLERASLRPLILMTGRGYHFSGRIPVGAPVTSVLAGLVPAGTPNAAWAGLGCVIEHVAHQVLRAAGGGAVPVVVNGLPVGPGARGRVAVAVDFSYAGDPLEARFIRSAFSTYQWHRLRPDIFGDRASALPPLVTVPRDGLSLAGALERGRTLDAGRRIARESSAGIPDVATGVERLLAEYLESPLSGFHRRFHAALRGDIRQRQAPAGLPPCVVAALGQPNDLLLKPEHLQHLVRTLLSRGWDAPQIALLLQDCYQADCGWGDRWARRMNPAMRAAFEARVFAGLIAAGTDRLVDFNCVSAQEKGLCPRTRCDHDLRRDRDALLRRTS